MKEPQFDHAVARLGLEAAKPYRSRHMMSSRTQSTKNPIAIKSSISTAEWGTPLRSSGEHCCSRASFQ